MVSVLNLSSGLGMVLVAVVAIAYWHIKKRPKAVYYAYGALFWAIAIVIKVVMDLTVSGPLYSWLYAFMPVEGAVAAAGLYLGLRTGIIENGIAYLGVKYSRLKEMGFKDAVAVGIGFGGIEAIVLGLLSLLTVVTLLMSPALVSLLPQSSIEQFEPLFMPLPVVERLFMLFGHAFATALAIYAVKLADLKWLGIAVLYKTLIDGSLPLFRTTGPCGGESPSFQRWDGIRPLLFDMKTIILSASIL
ncbi:YhfC family glutamic-type intramembrane protease [Methanocella conradii]|uniref:YhfC family glutamic-type intramembrane protease n=1 Tax=Methanocella conradii TaxID=1175444 RepID=UPI0020C6A3A5|nr:YhfC family glutamic-type intramembrane protease [Methanocella conradii]